jgi:anti-sigma factor RsiW
MNCEDLKNALHSYLERTLAPELRASIDAHAAACGPCGELLRTARELTCRQLAEFLHEYVDGALDPPRRAVFERHMKLCPPCLDFLESYRRTIELTGKACAPCDEDAPEIPEGVVRAILAARARELGTPPDAG